MSTAEPRPAPPVGTILVADDEDSIRWVLERACAQNGHTVVAVGSGNDALAALREKSFDVALVDIKMPDLSGLDVLARAREEGIDTLFKPKGCSRCRNLGYTGRIGIYELLVPDDNLIERISQGATLNEVRELAKTLGMKTLRQDGVDKVKSGITTLEEVYRATA